MSTRLLAAMLLLITAQPALAAGGGEGDSALSSLLWSFLNLALLLGIVGYFARKPVAEYLAQRREGIQTSLEQSAELLSDAESKLTEWTERASRLDSELGEIRETSRRLAEEEREEILAQARATAERIRSNAHAAVDQELRRARQTLADEAAELAVDLAAKLLSEQVTNDDQRRLFDEFLSKVEAGASGSGSGR